MYLLDVRVEVCFIKNFVVMHVSWYILSSTSFKIAYIYAYILNIFCSFTCVDLGEVMYVAFLSFYLENYIGMHFPMIIPNPPVFAFYILNFHLLYFFGTDVTLYKNII